MNIIGFIEMVDQVVPGFASYETLLYAPEIKFYSNRVKMDEKFNTNVKNLHCLGDSSGSDQRPDDGICHGCPHGKRTGIIVKAGSGGVSIDSVAPAFLAVHRFISPARRFS